MAEDARKWACPRCTFENWPRSLRCTLCDAPRQTLYHPVENKSPCIDTSNSKLFSGGWSCPTCTYDNWAASGRCTQCGTTSPLASTSKQPSTDYLPSSPSLTSLGVVKWICPSCTYENWPKSKRCVMCRSSPPPSSLASSSSCTITSTIDWISACKAVITGDSDVLKKFILTAGSLSPLSSRQLTPQDCQMLEQWSSGESNVLKPGLSLLDLARFYNRTEWVSSLSALYPTSSLTRPGAKRSVCQSSACAAKELRRLLDSCVRQRRGSFRCSYLIEFGTFYLPSEIRDLPCSSREVMLKELCDTEVQNELEVRSQVINWWVVEGQQNQPTSRLLALWNRTDGDCLLDSLMQACWGVFDQQSTLRHALTESIRACEGQFYRIWREHEVHQAASQYQPDEEQLLRDWHSALTAASLTRSPLEQIHIFVLAHVLRRPIIVYGVKYIHNYRDEPIGLANFEGVYLPLLWESTFCSRDPVILGYTRGHFTALVPIEPPRNPASPASTSSSLSSDGSSVTPASTVTSTASSSAAAAVSKSEGEMEDCASAERCDPLHLPAVSECSIYLPLFDRHGTPLPIPFASKSAVAPSDTQLLRDRLETMSTRRGLLLARLCLPTRRHCLVEDIVRDWLLVYRRMAATTPTPSPASANATDASGSNGVGVYGGRAEMNVSRQAALEASAVVFNATSLTSAILLLSRKWKLQTRDRQAAEDRIVPDQLLMRGIFSVGSHFSETQFQVLSIFTFEDTTTCLVWCDLGLLRSCALHRTRRSDC
ncbi:Ubiquitin thioesterase zranb1-A [Echinococcus granulosus]|uniref:ubiquitinyl hydrolase 1 n=1 Tax=Echinococcus granulosus TaxID=6210 RepID=W6UFB2_ECHGR|nr:Ubiquitin thioesterase zranb1-A [Echinococcus granulosus]XP_024351301.1 Ubiquitin thioesterase zranb1-A [Echinococcus granulosus]EUB60098.1 Ubiquitin thioesterase zranb1-A [Echinococcus granulosus]EUB60105.1 Ubiquitin thioesterase zranb1-A [Echinococcus granulosus]